MAGLKIALPLYGESLIYKLRAQMLTRGFATDRYRRGARLRVIGYRKTKRHAGPLTSQARGLDAAVVGLGYGLGDGQS
jgi:hypothetical protein